MSIFPSSFFADANVDIRDYSGKKAKHYLKKDASAFIQRKLDPTAFETPQQPQAYHHRPPRPTPGGYADTPTGGVNQMGQTPKSSGTSLSRALSRMSFRKEKKKYRRQESLP